MHESPPHSYVDCFGASRNIELFQNMGHVNLDRRFADVERRHLLVAFAAGNCTENLCLPRCRPRSANSLSRPRCYRSRDPPVALCYRENTSTS